MSSKSIVSALARFEWLTWKSGLANASLNRALCENLTDPLARAKHVCASLSWRICSAIIIAVRTNRSLELRSIPFLYIVLFYHHELNVRTHSLHLLLLL